MTEKYSTNCICANYTYVCLYKSDSYWWKKTTIYMYPLEPLLKACKNKIEMLKMRLSDNIRVKWHNGNSKWTSNLEVDPSVIHWTDIAQCWPLLPGRPSNLDIQSPANPWIIFFETEFLVQMLYSVSFYHHAKNKNIHIVDFPRKCQKTQFFDT